MNLQWFFQIWNVNVILFSFTSDVPGRLHERFSVFLSFWRLFLFEDCLGKFMKTDRNVERLAKFEPEVMKTDRNVERLAKFEPEVSNALELIV